MSRVGRVLGLFTTDSPEWGVSQVALELGVAKSSAHALLATLAEISLVRRLPDGRYRLGWRLVQLSRTLLDSADFVGPARPGLQRLADGLGAIVHVAGLRDREIVYLDRISGLRSPDVVGSRIGMAMPAHCTALGKTLLASLDDVETEAVLARHGLRRYTPRTITGAGALREEFARIRALGCAGDLEEAVQRVCCVAAPIRGPAGDVEAAMSITMTAAAFGGREAMLRATVRSAAAGISRGRRGQPRFAEVG
ncbi:IclR family transcriptional regulator [Streptomyces sp. NPDC004044]|uniref:IclR family transcriptional regulator n=1 Tax=Streptomyces sp. NPDC005356 TaxID=3157167 RepID=UPI0033BF1CFF